MSRERRAKFKARIGRAVGVVCILSFRLAVQGQTLDESLAALADVLNRGIIEAKARRVAVTPCEGLAPMGQDSRGMALAEALARHLKNAVYVDRMDRALADKGLIAELNSADLVVTCFASDVPDGIDMSYRLVSARSGLRLESGKIHISRDAARILSPRTITVAEAINTAQIVTQAIVRGNSAEAEKYFQREFDDEVRTIQRSIKAVSPIMVQPVKTSLRQISRVSARTTCNSREFEITATIREDDHRLLGLSTSNATEAAQPVSSDRRLMAEADFRVFAEDIERASKASRLFLPQVTVSMSRLREQFCKNAAIAVFERETAPPIEVVAVFLTLDAFGQSRIPIRVDVKRDGTIAAWEVLPAADATQSQAEGGGGEQDERPVVDKEVIRKTLEQNISETRRTGSRALEGLAKYGVGTKNYHLADDAIPVLDHVREITMEALAVPQLEPLRRWMATALDAARPVVVERTLVVEGEKVVYRLIPVAEVIKFKKYWEAKLTKLEQMRDVAPNIKIVSEPGNAAYWLFIENDAGASYRGTTTDTVMNVYRGFYDLVIQKIGHKPCKPCVQKANGPHAPCMDLVDDPRTTIACQLVDTKSGGECTCHRE